MRIFQQAVLKYTEDKFTAFAHGSAQIDLRSPYTTLRLRLKPAKFLAHLDLGRYVLARPLSPAEMVAQPYAFFATNRAFDHHLYSLGNFLALAKDLYSHLRVSVIKRGAASEVFAQHNLVKAWPGLTFNHLLYFKAFSAENQVGNTVNVLATYGRAQLRAEVSEQRQDKCGRESSEAKLSLGCFLAEDCFVGLNHVRDLIAWTPLTELAVAYRHGEAAELKAKIDCGWNASAFFKYRLDERAAVTLGLSGSLRDPLKAGGRRDLPLGFSLGLRFKH